MEKDKTAEKRAAQKDTTKAMVEQLLGETRKLREEVGYVRALLAAQQNARYEYHLEVVKDNCVDCPEALDFRPRDA